MMESNKAVKYKYYILSKNNNSVSGVLAESETDIFYNDLTICPVFNMFSGVDEERLVKYYESPIRQAAKDQLEKEFGTVEITKEYWTAWEHATGRKRKAVSRNTEN